MPPIGKGERAFGFVAHVSHIDSCAERRKLLKQLFSCLPSQLISKKRTEDIFFTFACSTSLEKRNTTFAMITALLPLLANSFSLLFHPHLIDLEGQYFQAFSLGHLLVLHRSRAICSEPRLYFKIHHEPKGFYNLI